MSRGHKFLASLASVLLVVVMIFSFNILTSHLHSETQDQSQKSFFEEVRLIDIAKISHVERSVHVLKFAHNKLGTDFATDQEIVYLINAEWNGALRNLYLISAQDVFADDELRRMIDPLNNPDKDNLKRSIAALEEKIAKARKHFNLSTTATDLMKE